MTDSTRIGFSNRLDLDRFFFEVRGEIYVVIKLHEDFPNYHRGSDMDVFCYDKAGFAKCILSVGNRHLDQGFEIRVADKNETHTYVDFYFDGELDFRFDLYGSLPKYKGVQLKEHYIYSVIENASIVEREFDGAQYPLYVPSTVDDLLLRYVEYIEWYETRPDKVKHLDYILNAVSENPGRIGFLDKLHLYTELPEPELKQRGLKRFYLFRWLAFWINKAQSVPPRRIPAAIYRRLRRRL